MRIWEDFKFIQKIGLVSLILFLGAPAFAESLTSYQAFEPPAASKVIAKRPICETVPQSQVKSTAEEREALLKKIKGNLITQAEGSAIDLRLIRDYIVQCSDTHCRAQQAQFLSSLRTQVQLAKMVKAINMRPNKFRTHLRAPRSEEDLLNRYQAGDLDPRSIGNFDLKDFEFSDQEKEKTRTLWMKTFVDISAKMPPGSSFQDTLKQVEVLFKKMSTDLLDRNPLLAFVDEESLKDPQVLVKALDKLIKFNHDFLDSAEDLKTKHKTTLLSYPNLTVTDHEMGLVNFSKLAEKLIEESAEDRTQLIRSCRAWQDLKKQKKIRTWSSIGVGLTTATICAVGVYAKLTRVGTAKRCILAVADSLWGARIGGMAASISKDAFYAGRSLSIDGQFTEGFLNTKESRSQVRAAQVVFAINVLGLLPIGYAIATAKAGGKGTIKELITLPSSDTTVSTVETQASTIAYGMLVLRSSELFRDDLDAEVQELMQRD